MSDILEKARNQGWVPQEEWQGDPDQWVDAKEFVYRGELLDRISKQNKELRNLQNRHKQEVTDLKKKMLKMGEQWTKDRLSTLDAEMDAAERAYEMALEDGDKAKADRVRTI